MANYEEMELNRLKAKRASGKRLTGQEQNRLYNLTERYEDEQELKFLQSIF